MSMHEIEDLVEETARLVLASEDESREQKLAILGELFLVQGWFDTSDTSGRLEPELTALGYVDEAGPEQTDLLRLGADMMAAGERAGREDITHGWLALVLTAITSLDIFDQIPATFQAMLTAGHGTRMREMALHGKLHTRWRNSFYLEVPVWGRFSKLFPQLEDTVLEKRFILRYLSDSKADEQKIQADYETERRKIDSLADLPLYTLPERLTRLTSLFHLGNERVRDYRRFIFTDREQAPTRDQSRLFVVIEHCQDLGLLTLEVRVQSGLLLGWQDGEGTDNIANTHFRVNSIVLIPSADLNADKSYSSVGGWPFKLEQSARLLDTRLAAIAGHLKHLDGLRKFHQKPLDQFLAASTPENMEKRRRTLRDKHGFFLNDIELLFAYACVEWESGRRPDAMIAKLAHGLKCVVDIYPLKPTWEKGLQILHDRPWFPPLTETMSYRRLEHPA